MDTEFCEVCCHSVYDMEKHLKTEEHKRKLKKLVPRKPPVIERKPKKYGLGTVAR